MMLHKKQFAFSFSTVLALATLSPSAPVLAAEIVDLQEECVPFRFMSNVYHQRCTVYATYDTGLREVVSQYNKDENGIIYDP